MLARATLTAGLIYCDIYFRAKSNELTPEKIDELSRRPRDANELPLIGGRRLRWPKFWRSRAVPGFIYAPEVHDLLDDQADWNAAHWLFTPEGNARIAETVRLLASELPKGFDLEVLWEGDQVKSSEKTTPDDLVAIISANQIGTRTRYLVRPPQQL